MHLTFEYLHAGETLDVSVMFYQGTNDTDDRNEFDILEAMRKDGSKLDVKSLDRDSVFEEFIEQYSNYVGTYEN